MCERWCPQRPQASGLPAAGVTGGCELSNVGAGNGTCVFYNSSTQLGMWYKLLILALRR